MADGRRGDEVLTVGPRRSATVSLMTMPVPYATDQPIGDSSDDRFGRRSFAYRIAHTLAHRSDPSSIVVGIYGAWGEGKTSVLRMIDEALTNERDVKTFWFNPWRYGDEDTLLEQFFRSMAGALGSSLSSRTEELGGLLQRYKHVLRPLLAFGGAAAKGIAGFPTPLPDGASVLGEHVDGIASALSEVDAETLKARIDERLATAKTRLVVFMDDLDRLDQSEIQSVFRLVKLTLSFTNTAFVLAFDDDVVAQALTPQFGPSSRKFLEKIIQVPLQLPHADILLLRTFCFAGVEDALRVADVELSDAEARRFVNVFDQGMLSRLTTPRSARRYANTLAFSLPILKDEVNPVDLMLIEAVRVFYPRLYSSIRSNRDLYVWSIGDHISDRDADFKKRKREPILKSLDDLSETDRDAAMSVVKALFPLSATALSDQSVGYSDETINSWNVDKRVASREYFDRYFAYGVPPNDISDRDFATFVGAIAQGRASNEVNSDVHQFCSGGRTERFLEKIRVASHALPPEHCALLAVAVVRNASLFTADQPAGIGFTDLRETAALRVYWLIERLPRPRQGETLLECIRSTNDVLFILEVVRWCRPDDDNKMLSIPDYEKIRPTIVEKIRAAAYEQPLWRAFGRATGRVLAEWADAAGKEATNHYLMSRFAADPQEVLPFLESMLLNAKQLFTGRPVRKAFSKHSYDVVASVANVDEVAEVVRSLGFAPRLGPQYEELEVGPEVQSAQRFLALYEEAQNPSGTADVQP
jgi:hypothetical protein